MKNIPTVIRPDVLTPESKEKYKQDADSFLSFITEFIQEMKEYKSCPNCGCKNKGDYCLHCFYKFN